MQHKAEIKYPGGAEQLAEDLGNLRYDTLSAFLELLSIKLTKDSEKDASRDREQLAMALRTAAQAVHGASGWIDIAWKISKPYMESKNDNNALV